MGNFSLTGVLLVVGVFFVIFTFILTQIDVANPYTGTEQSALSMILDWTFSVWYTP